MRDAHQVGTARATREFLLPENYLDAAPCAGTAGGVESRSGRSIARVVWIPFIVVCADLAAFAAATALTSEPSPKLVALLTIVLVLFHVGGLYRPRLTLSVLDDAPAIVGRALAAGAAAMVLGGLDDGVAGTARLATSAAFGALSVVTRAAAYSVIRCARRRGRLYQRTLLLGAGTLAGYLAANLVAHPEYGLRPVGMLDDEPLLTEEERAVPVLGGYTDLNNVLLGERVDVVVVTYGSLREPLMIPLLRACDRLSCEIFFVPRLYEMHTVTRDTELLWGVPLVRMRRAAFRSGAWMAKRVTDLVISGLGLFLLLPLLGCCAVASRVETGCVLFRQIRIGMDGRPFTLLKFCSLRPAVESEAGTQWNIGEDTRVGPFGRFMRRTSLDELPQLFNVLRGDMSLVGPRPERPHFVDEFTRQYPWYTARHRVPVGLTGWAQVHGLRGDTSIADRARFDNFYIENWSMYGDVKILLRTAAQVLRAAGR
ncbi:sugar transferase [Geodermatophilus telluris]|uniref:sugar transferase n=1 Tax=Geodermatophilus telluris TaxID=1190417 RepID=UPI001587623F|nr:sugar transferase [Geodermatophilus telluris]